MTFSYDDYTVAWICALPVEMWAAKIMLDEVHPSLRQPQSDHNVYTLGSISGHNMVVACLPTVVAHMVSTSSNTLFGLMVGIGGRVLSKHVDIRLGDVVVSKPTATLSGHNGTLNKPPPVLLKVISQVESDYMTAEDQFSNILADTPYNKEIEKFSRPKKPNCSKYLDVLYFEMEAAALIDKFPLFVIRGICNYSNAALVAAVYTKAFLRIVPVLDHIPFERNWKFIDCEKKISKVQELVKQEKGPSRIVIYGLGRIDKTDVTLELVYRTQEKDFSRSIFWIPCTSYEHMKPAETKEHGRSYFSQKSTGKWLLVFDYADNIDMWIKDSEITPLAAIILLKRLVFLPLAISQAAAFINKNKINISIYVTLLEKHESYIIELLSEDSEDKDRYKAIQNPVATTCPHKIPLLILPRPVSDVEIIKAIGVLNTYSFISRQKERNFLSKYQLFSLQVSKTAGHLNKIFPDDDHSNRKLWRLYLPHSPAVIGEANFQDVKEKYINLVWKVRMCLYGDGRYNEAELLYMEVLGTQKQVPGPEHPSTLTNMANLVLTYREQGRWKEAE
ncbi:hypothetical protein BDV23DRAFT_168402 [Aspergillus alliaceus]|uniref:Nucleoside phosphorylase domain-containing protein n=1 Tax=Petromyces alliaceus TaxID=209559 RepID=A0A5N7CR26_PETAA|nr:hypothetical protein BDV23DRAFT_168402 [Aspergillus alliaceus]